MSSTHDPPTPEDEECEIDLSDVEHGTAPPLPPTAPPDFRARLAAALGACTPDVLAAAEGDFRGVYVSSDEYIKDIIGNQLPGFLQWILACTEVDKLREGYENRSIVIWEIRLSDDRVMVFESLRAP